jgi:uroporphyrin-III C-methyltransferase
MPGTVYIVGAGPGEPELITLKGARVLKEADAVLYDRLVDPALLDLCRPSALRVFVGKRCGKASVTQNEINDLMVRHANDGLRVVRLKGGDPFVFGRGGEECLALARAGIPFEVIPGVSSATSVPAYAGIPVTHRNLAAAFTVVSGHLHGDTTPHDWSWLASSPTLVVLMGLRNLSEIANRLIEAGKPADTPAAAIRAGTGQDQRTIMAPLDRIAHECREMEPPAVVVIGAVAALHAELAWFGLEGVLDGAPTA